MINLIDIKEEVIVFDLMKKLPKELISEFQVNWRGADREFYKRFFSLWQELPSESVEISFLRKNIEEIIVKDIYGRDIFSIKIEECRVYGRIEMYQRFWTAIYEYDRNQKKLILFTM